MLDCPVGASPCIGEAGPRSVTYNAANSGGSTTSTGAALPITVAAGGTSLRFQVEPETGLFRALP